MNPEKIEEFIVTKGRKNAALNIHFKDRGTVTGIFIHTNDYDELKSKNFWRIVSEVHIEEWRKTKDDALSRIFNGTVFTRLSEREEKGQDAS